MKPSVLIWLSTGLYLSASALLAAFFFTNTNLFLYGGAACLFGAILLSHITKK